MSPKKRRTRRTHQSPTQNRQMTLPWAPSNNDSGAVEDNHGVEAVMSLPTTFTESDDVSFVTPTSSGQPPDPPSITTIATNPDPDNDRPRYRLYSWVWNHGDLSFGNRGQRLWKCRHCPAYRPMTYHCSSTTHISYHLRSSHNIQRAYVAPAPATATQQTLASLRPNPAVVRKTLVAWILSDHQAFRTVENERFRAFLDAIMTMQPASVLPTRQTLRRWILNTFDEDKLKIATSFALAKSHIHISFDTWTSPNHLSFFGVVAHWTNEGYELCTALVALKPIDFGHSGEELAKLLMSTFEEYGIADKIGYFVSDNATNLTTTVEEVSRQLFTVGNTILTSDERRLRCWAHVVNLAAHCIFDSKKPNDSIDAAAFELLPDDDGLQEQREAFNEWRRHRSIKKLHSFVVFLRATPARRNLFMTIQSQQLHLETAHVIRLAVVTRWNSAFDMITDSLKLRDAIDLFLSVLAARHPKDRATIMRYQLTAEEWEELRFIADILSPIKDVSTFMQGKIAGAAGYNGNGALSDVLPGFDHLLNHLEHWKDQLIGRGLKNLATCVNLAWAKLDAYYKMTDSSAIYIVATVLDPRLKMAYFQQAWADKPDWIEMAMQRLRRCPYLNVSF